VAKPPAALVERFSRLAAPLLGKIAHNERESRTLAELQNTLLPRLISGEIRVNRAQQILEELA
jgi:type I restriction enzyme S subunit